jgi:hypothetical protein
VDVSAVVPTDAENIATFIDCGIQNGSTWKMECLLGLTVTQFNEAKRIVTGNQVIVPDNQGTEKTIA